MKKQSTKPHLFCPPPHQLEALRRGELKLIVVRCKPQPGRKMFQVHGDASENWYNENPDYPRRGNMMSMTWRCPLGRVGDEILFRKNNKQIWMWTYGTDHTSERRYFAMDTSLAKRRLYGGKRWEDLFSNKAGGGWEESSHGLVSIERMRRKRQGSIPDGVAVSSEQKENDQCSSLDVHGVSRNAGEANIAGQAFGRKPNQQSAVESEVGDTKRQCGRQDGARKDTKGRDSSPLEIHQRGEVAHSLGNQQGALQSSARGDCAGGKSASNSGHDEDVWPVICRVKSVEVRRVNTITEDEARESGLTYQPSIGWYDGEQFHRDHRDAFSNLYDSSHGVGAFAKDFAWFCAVKIEGIK